MLTGTSDGRHSTRLIPKATPAPGSPPWKNPTSISPAAQARVQDTVFGAPHPHPIHQLVLWAVCFLLCSCHNPACKTAPASAGRPAPFPTHCQGELLKRHLSLSWRASLVLGSGSPPLTMALHIRHPLQLPSLPSCAPLFSPHSCTSTFLLVHECTGSLCLSAFAHATPGPGMFPDPTSISSNLGSSLFSILKVSAAQRGRSKIQRAMYAESRACPYPAATGASERLMAEEGCPGASADAGLKAAVAGGGK